MNVDWDKFAGVIGGAEVTRAQIVAEARTWIGTPYHHQGDNRNGVDCGGLIKAVLMAVGLLPTDYLSRLPQARGYSRTPHGNLLATACGVVMEKTTQDSMAPGDVVLLRWSKFPHHLGILGDHPHGGLSLIHSENYRAGKVTEHRLAFDAAMKFVAAYKIPGVV